MSQIDGAMYKWVTLEEIWYSFDYNRRCPEKVFLRRSELNIDCLQGPWMVPGCHARLNYFARGTLGEVLFLAVVTKYIGYGCDLWVKCKRSVQKNQKKKQ